MKSPNGNTNYVLSLSSIRSHTHTYATCANVPTIVLGAIHVAELGRVEKTDGAHQQRRGLRRRAGLPQPLPLAVVVYRPRELQRLAPPPQQYRPPPHARSVVAAVQEVLAALPAVSPALPLPDPSGLHHLPQRPAALDDEEAAVADIAAARAAREEGAPGGKAGGRDALPAPERHQPTGEGGEEGGHDAEHGVKARPGARARRQAQLNGVMASWSSAGRELGRLLNWGSDQQAGSCLVDRLAPDKMKLTGGILQITS